MKEVPLNSTDLSKIGQEKSYENFTSIVGLAITIILFVVLGFLGKFEFQFLTYLLFLFILFTKNFRQSDFKTDKTKLSGSINVFEKNIIKDTDDADYFEIKLKSGLIPNLFVNQDFWEEIDIDDEFYIEIMRKTSFLLTLQHKQKEVKIKLDKRKIVEVNRYAIV